MWHLNQANQVLYHLCLICQTFVTNTTMEGTRCLLRVAFADIRRLMSVYKQCLGGYCWAN